MPEAHLTHIVCLIFNFEDISKPAPSQPLLTLHRAASEENIEIVKFILQNEKPDINLKDDKGRTALHLSAEKEHFNISKMLLTEFKADVNVRDVFNRTPLHLSASNGNFDAVELFVKQFKCDVKAKDNDGRTPLHPAAESRHFDIVKFMMDFGVDVNARWHNIIIAFRCKIRGYRCCGFAYNIFRK